MKSAYIHIPFCNTICSYCDFCKVYYDSKLVSSYLDALKREIKKDYLGEKLSTIYIGGGTPSSLSLEELKELLEILAVLQREREYEYTVECNIENITEEKVALLSSYGVNRISIGVQTFQEKYLTFLNRKHTKKEVFEKVEMIKKYISNINIDLIYAIPRETLEELEEDLDCFLSLGIPHLSTYSLMIEEHTILNNKGIKPIDEELDFKMYELIQKKLRQFHHYEISNFAIKGYESKHNLTYWNNEEYYGFGCGASGYVRETRYTNTKSIQNYIKEFKKIECYKVSRKEKIENEFLLGFRKLDGISISHFEKKYHRDLLSYKTVQEFIEQGKLEVLGDYLKIVEGYFYISNEILVSFIDCQEDF